MNDQSLTLTGGLIFDGVTLHRDQAAQFKDGIFQRLISPADIAASDRVCDLEGDIVSPGYVDLQVNGGDGIMFNDDPSVATLARIAGAHRRLGTYCLLPTLITDSVDKTAAAIDAAQRAIASRVAGIAGLHLEGPHISVARKGAHDDQYIRPMDTADLHMLLDARRQLPVLKITVAPENVTSEQVSTLADAGVLVSLGHTNADFDTCKHYIKAGARCATHLFNAMSQLGNREPGLVGAALESPELSAGLIADGIHVHSTCMRIACQAKAGPGRIYLVSDAMAVAGSERREFFLDGRRISRANGRLTLDDGTLAGADLNLTTAIRVLKEEVGVPLQLALQAATSVPASLIDVPASIVPGATRLDALVRISSTLLAVQSFG